jgi:hypothetical protein
MAEVKEQAATKVITGKCRLSYAHLFEPKAVQEGGDKKYSVSLIIPKSDTVTVAKIKAAVNAAIAEGKNSKFAGKATNLKMPLRDGDAERPEDENYANSYFINATSKQKPGLIDKDRSEILDAADLYSGCYGRASLNFYAFNTNGNKGIAAGLNNVQKLAEGEPLGGRSRAEDDFSDDVEVEDDLVG